MFRDLSVKHDIPQMRCLGSNNPPEKIRQSMYVSLAYGVQAFHFWPPWFVTCKMDKDRKNLLDRRRSGKEGKGAKGKYSETDVSMGDVD